MALTPSFNRDIKAPQQLPIQPSKTYKMDWDTGRISGMVDETSALYQFIEKTLNTERFKFLIYNDQYGREFEALLEGDYTENLLESELTRLIIEALIYDERIINIRDFKFEFHKDSIQIQFFVDSIFGKFDWVHRINR